MKMTSQKWDSKEDKKLLKPLMEKRRRDRMNQSLDRLRVLLFEATRDERLKNPKVEKAEILQKTVQFLKIQPLSGAPVPLTEVQQEQHHFLAAMMAPTTFSAVKGTDDALTGDRKLCLEKYTGNVGSCLILNQIIGPSGETKHMEDTLLQRYHRGYRECLTQATHFLRASPGICTGKKAYLMEHICHCMEKITASPGGELCRPPLATSNPSFEIQQQRYSPDEFAGCSLPLGGAAYILHPAAANYPTSQGLQTPGGSPAQQGDCSRSEQQSKLLAESRDSAAQSPQALNVWRPWP